MLAWSIVLLVAQELPDFSWAGYHRGEEPPRREATRELGPGEHRLEDVIEIRSSGYVLRGAGSKKTILLCPRSLTQIRGPSRGWSWSGGMIWVRPPAGKTTKVGDVTGGGPVRLAVRWSARPAAGEWLQLVWFNDKGKDTLLDHLYGGVIPRARMGEELRQSDGVRVREWVRLKEVGDDFAVLTQPLRLDVRKEWRCRLLRRPYLSEVGIEGLTIRFPKTRYPGHLKEKGYNAIQLSEVIHGWVRDVVIENADSGIFVGNCKHVTVSDVVISGRMMHHCLSASWSQDCLFTRWRIEAPHVHGTTISWCAHGNVFSHGWGRALAMDSHRAASFMNLHTAIVIDHGDRVWNPFRSGGSRPRGPHAAKSNVYWNVENRFSGEGPARIGGHGEWPLGVFCGWHGNRPLRFDPIPGLEQRILELNQKPAIEDLHSHQRNAR